MVFNWLPIGAVEINDWCNSKVAKYFPNSQCFTDIKQFDGTKFRNTINIISGGFPCQLFSVAGKQRGKEDDRFLWLEMYRIIHEIQPAFIVAENVPGLISQGVGLVFEQIIFDLENEGFEVLPFFIPAIAVGAWHKRERLWIVAHSDGERCEKQYSPSVTEKKGIRFRDGITGQLNPEWVEWLMGYPTGWTE